MRNKKMAFETHPCPGLNPVEPLVRHCYVFLERAKYIYISSIIGL